MPDEKSDIICSDQLVTCNVQRRSRRLKGGLACCRLVASRRRIERLGCMVHTILVRDASPRTGKGSRRRRRRQVEYYHRRLVLTPLLLRVHTHADLSEGRRGCMDSFNACGPTPLKRVQSPAALSKRTLYESTVMRSVLRLTAVETQGRYLIDPLLCITCGFDSSFFWHRTVPFLP